MTKFNVLATMRAIRGDKSLSTTQKAFLWDACLRTNNTTCKVRMSLEGLAEDCGASSKTAYRVFSKENENVLKYFSRVERNSRTVDLWFFPLPDTESVIDEDSESPNEVDGHSVQVDGLSVQDDGHRVPPSTSSSTSSSTNDAAVPAAKEAREETEAKEDEESSNLSLPVVTETPSLPLEENAAGTADDDIDFAVYDSEGRLLGEHPAPVADSDLGPDVETLLSTSEHPSEARALFLDPEWKPEKTGELRARWAAWMAEPALTH
jgi:hypothetical protein